MEFLRVLFRYSVLIIAALLAAGLTMAARLYLRKHTPLEVYAGFALALFLTAGIHQYLS